MDPPPALRAAIEGVLLHRSHLRKLLPDSMPSAEHGLPQALAIGGNGPATAAWAVWQAIEVLERAWADAQRPDMGSMHVTTDAPLLPPGEALAGVGVKPDDDGCLACQ